VRMKNIETDGVPLKTQAIRQKPLVSIHYGVVHCNAEPKNNRPTTMPSDYITMAPCLHKSQSISTSVSQFPNRVSIFRKETDRGVRFNEGKRYSTRKTKV
jgi:hypothetical protein